MKNKVKNHEIREHLKSIIQTTMFNVKPVTQTKIAFETGLTQPTISNWLKSKSLLINRNLNKVENWIKKYENNNID